MLGRASSHNSCPVPH